MTREHLVTASDLLETAAESADGDAATRLNDLAGQLDRLATAERGPDHGRLARIENALDELREASGPIVTDAIDSAHEHVVAYRETVEGV